MDIPYSLLDSYVDLTFNFVNIDLNVWYINVLDPDGSLNLLDLGG